MDSVSINIELLSDFLISYLTMTLYSKLEKKTTVFQIILNIVVSIIFGIIGFYFDDFSFLIFLLLFFCFSVYINKSKNKAIRNSNVFLLSLMIEITLNLFSSSIGRILGRVLNTHLSLYPIEDNDFFLLLSMVINILLIWVLCFFVKKKLGRKIEYIQLKTKELKLSGKVFFILFSLFISFEIILLVSDFESVTATIRLVILTVFIATLSFMIWEMVNLISIFNTRQKVINDIRQNKKMNEYLVNIQDQYEDLRKFKHDFKNIVLSMNIDRKFQ